MKILIWHCAKIRVNNQQLSSRMKAIDFRHADINESDSLVLWITVEFEDDDQFFPQLLREIMQMRTTFQTQTVAIVPFGHLSSQHCSRKIAYEILQKLKLFLEARQFVVKLAHFGSAKDVEFLSEAHEQQVKFRSYPEPSYVSTSSELAADVVV